MKKTLAILTALAVSAFCVNAYAQIPEQDNQLFNHWSVGVGIGLTEGVQFSAATTITPNLQARIIFNTISPVVAIANPIVSRNVENLSLKPLSFTQTGLGIKSNSPKIDLDKIVAEGKLQQSNLAVLADFFPSANGVFHLTGGVILNFSPAILSTTASMYNAQGGPAIDPSNYAKTEFFGLSTDLEGKLHMDVKYGLQRIQPYLGVGFGRPVDVNGRVGFNFDLGVAYVGGVHVVAKNYYKNIMENPENPTPVDVELNKAWIDANPDIKDALGADYDSITKYMNLANSFPIEPFIRFTLSVRLF